MKKPKDNLEELLPLANNLTASENGVWEVPYGDVPYALEGVSGIQRLNRAVAERMVKLFNSWRGRLHRRFGGCPVYIGHPDVEYFANRGDTDKKAYGWIKALEARSDCLALQVDLAEPGRALLANKAYKWFSPFFYGRRAGTENGKTIYEPVWLESAGFTNTPRWPVAALVNSEDLTANTAAQQQKGGGMDLLQRLIALLGLGKEGAEPATEDGAVSAVAKLQEAAKKMKEEIKARWDASDAAFAAVPNSAAPHEKLPVLLKVLDGRAAEAAELANAKTAAETRSEELEQALTAERAARAELLVNSAAADGRITPAEKDAWKAKLLAVDGFEAAEAELANAEPKLKTSSATGDLGARQSSAAVTRARVVAMVNSRMEKDKVDYQTAFNLVKADNPGLFEVTEQ